MTSRLLGSQQGLPLATTDLCSSHSTSFLPLLKTKQSSAVLYFNGERITRITEARARKPPLKAVDRN